MITPASIRNNNPGAQYPGKSAKKFGGIKHEVLRSRDGVHKIATFPTSIHGAAAQFDLLHRAYTGITIRKAIEKWCGGYYASTYLQVLRDRAGIDENTILTKAMVADHAIAIPLAKAMAWQEAGREYPMTDDEWLEAHVMCFDGSSAPSWNPRNDVPTPKPETRVAAVVEKIQKTGAVVAGGIVAGGTAVKSLTETPLPAPPAGVTDTLSNLAAWGKVLSGHTAGIMFAGAATFAAVAVLSVVIKRWRE